MLTNQKREFVRQLQYNANELALAMNKAIVLKEVFDDREYDGTDFDATDLEEEGIDASLADLSAFMNFAGELDNLLNNAAVTPGDYGAVLNKARTL